MNYHVEFGGGRGQWDDFHCNRTFPAACKKHLLPYLTGDGAMKAKASFLVAKVTLEIAGHGN